MSKVDEAALVKQFDHTEARWQDEKAYEDFSDYQMFMKRMCTASGVKMNKLEAEPFKMYYTVGKTKKVMFVDAKKNQIITEEV